MATPAVKCPKCSKSMTYVRADGEWLFYRCPTHRVVVLARDSASQAPAPRRRGQRQLNRRSNEPIQD